MTLILHRAIPYETAPRPLPGIRGLQWGDWLHRDEVFAQQMALRDALLRDKSAQVMAAEAGQQDMCSQLLRFVLEWLAQHDPEYEIRDEDVTRPDGVSVPLEFAYPLRTLGRLVQEDFCLLTRQGEEHVLSAAVVCFPAGWRLAEKIGRPLGAIHAPVPSYLPVVAKRVQRLFDAVAEDRPLWRFNALPYAGSDLFQPNKKSGKAGEKPEFFRSERQSILRLPGAAQEACVFSIHTYLCRASDLVSQDAKAANSKL
ncbi:MAG: DUF3445 domain-containing protein [Pseudomonadota bacterium]